MPKRIPAVVAALALAAALAVCGPGATPASPAAPAASLDILLTNDDGWRGPGGADTPLIVALRDALVAAGHRVVVVAPATDQSGQGGRLTAPPLTLDVASPEQGVYTVAPGSPVDSTYFGLDEVFAGGAPDVVVSGLNPGQNLTSGVNHSGTVNAALAALEYQVPSIAVSVEARPDWRAGTARAAPAAAAYTVDLVAALDDGRPLGAGLLPPGVALNVNYPVVPGPVDPATGQPGSVLAPRGTQATTLGVGLTANFDYRPLTGGPGAPGTYAVDFGALAPTPTPGSDVAALAGGYVSVTPLERDRDVDPATDRWMQRFLRTLG